MPRGRIRLVLALLAAACCAAAPLLISVLFSQDVPQAIASLDNLLLFTAESTRVVAHVARDAPIDDAAELLLRAAPAARRRAHVNPERARTEHNSGSILRQHVSNVEHARFALGLAFESVLLMPSNTRLVVRGVERYVGEAGFAHAAPWKYEAWTQASWDAGTARAAGVRPPAAPATAAERAAAAARAPDARCDCFGDAPAECAALVARAAADVAGGADAHAAALAACRFRFPSFLPFAAALRAAHGAVRWHYSAHEGFFAPADAVLSFAAFLRSARADAAWRFVEQNARRGCCARLAPPDASGASLLELMSRTTASVGFDAVEETWLQTFIATNATLRARAVSYTHLTLPTKA